MTVFQIGSVKNRRVVLPSTIARRPQRGYRVKKGENVIRVFTKAPVTEIVPTTGDKKTSALARHERSLSHFLKSRRKRRPDASSLR